MIKNGLIFNIVSTITVITLKIQLYILCNLSYGNNKTVNTTTY